MKAWISREAGGPESLVLQERPVPGLGARDVLVEVRAVGVNFPDGLLIRDKYQIKPPRPFVPGSEFCGVVAEIGTEVTRFKPGDVVAGGSGWGALSEYIVMAERHLFRIPSSFPVDEAAAFLFAYATAYHALHDVGRVRAGETLVVLGAAGGVGSAAVEVGRALGAHVIAAASTREKVDFARARGAANGLVYDAHLTSGEGQKELAGRLKTLAPAGVHAVVDPVGGPYTEPALRSLARGGRHLVVGFTAGIPSIPLNIALIRGRQILGVDWYTFVQVEPEANEHNVDALFDLWRSGDIRPLVTERFPFTAAPDAIERLDTRQATGKVVVSLRP
ncbi:NADPH:quinone oxidoreductase family protein [Streptomyces sp. NRRL F-5126]|uniref:NADPH:quinone oxidoreductase family protein n=1 Tax=Streptomyces sp. NRRL F-5126 TaxID=1463857 RepID=UPI0004C58D94|nr:NADPH:quinone oxidoreductase family protein [Streptomyces sp. NRRL F-5126]